MNAPLNIIESPQYNEQELKARTDVFIAEGGPWARYMESLRQLKYIVLTNTHPPEGYQGTTELPAGTIEAEKKWQREMTDRPFNPHLALYRPDFVPLDERDVSGGAAVVSYIFDALANGPLANVNHDFLEPLQPYKIAFDQNTNTVVKKPAEPRGINYEKAIRRLVERFDTPYLNPETYQRYEALSQRGERIEDSKIPFLAGVSRKDEEFKRAVEEIQHWATGNAHAIPESDQKLIAGLIRENNAAYAGVLAYVDYAKGYIAHMDGKEPERIVG